MKNLDIMVECLADIFQNLGIEATTDQLKTIAEDFSLHIEMEDEMSFNQHFDRSEKICSKCELLTSKLKDANDTIGIYRNSVKQRRNASEVWIEGDEVKYSR